MEARTVKTRPFLFKLTEEAVMPDLEILRDKALESGAAAAEIIPASHVMVDERVRLKCIVPRCLRAGETPNCPPYVPELDVIREAFAKFSWALLLKTHLEPVEAYAPGSKKGQTEQSLLYHQKTGEIVYEIERLAYKHGYHLAMGFAGGPCKNAYCPNIECSALIPRQGCRHPLRARVSMEGVGMDVYLMATKVGWDIYPIGEGVSPSEVPHGAKLGLVFIC